MALKLEGSDSCQSCGRRRLFRCPRHAAGKMAGKGSAAGQRSTRISYAVGLRVSSRRVWFPGIAGQKNPPGRETQEKARRAFPSGQQVSRMAGQIVRRAAGQQARWLAGHPDRRSSVQLISRDFSGSGCGCAPASARRRSGHRRSRPCHRAGRARRCGRRRAGSNCRSARPTCAS